MSWLQGRHGLEDSAHPASLILWQPLTLHQALGAGFRMFSSLHLEEVIFPSLDSESWALGLNFCSAISKLCDFWLEKGMATHTSILPWRIPWTEEPSGLQSMGLQRVKHDCFLAVLTCEVERFMGLLWASNTVVYLKRTLWAVWLYLQCKATNIIIIFLLPVAFC